MYSGSGYSKMQLQQTVIFISMVQTIPVAVDG